jgi:transcriptional regulator with XRE-family HTH domain
MKADPAIKCAPDMLGSTIRHTRKACRLTQKNLAERIGRSESLLSKIERGSVTPTLPILHKLAEVLGINIAALFSDTNNGTVATYNRGERLILDLGVQGAKSPDIKLERMIPYVEGRLLDANLHVVPPGGGSAGSYSHVGEEVGFVVSGYIELTVDGNPILLTTGGSFFFNSNLPHSYRNVGSTEAQIVWVNSSRV